MALEPNGIRNALIVLIFFAGGPVRLAIVIRSLFVALITIHLPRICCRLFSVEYKSRLEENPEERCGGFKRAL